MRARARFPNPDILRPFKHPIPENARKSISIKSDTNLDTNDFLAIILITDEQFCVRIASEDLKIR